MFGVQLVVNIDKCEIKQLNNRATNGEVMVAIVELERYKNYLLSTLPKSNLSAKFNVNPEEDNYGTK